MTVSEPLSPVKNRPKDRKQQITACAREMFVEHGFSNVTMAAIARRSGITAGALYRHFDNKTDLLEAVFNDSLGYLDEPIRCETLSDLADLGVEVVNSHPHVGVLWLREIRHLPSEVQLRFRLRLRDWAASIVPLVTKLRPELDRAQTELLVWALVSVVASLFSRTGRTPTETEVRIMREAVTVVAHVPLAKTGRTVQQTPYKRAESVRERLLQAAIEQFGTLGYSQSSLASIGAAADVSGPNLYSHFDSKKDLLQAVIDRGNHAAWFVLDRALSAAGSAEEALSRLVLEQLRFPPVWAHRAMEVEYGDDMLRHLRESQKAFNSEWVALVRQAVPGLPVEEARVRVGIAVSVLRDLAEVDRVSRYESFPHNAQAVALRILLNRAD